MALVPRDEYHLTIMNDQGLVGRLAHELGDVPHQYQLTWPEFKRDPFGFTKRTFVGYGQMFMKFLRKPNVLLAIGAAFLGMLALVGAVMLMDRAQGTTTSRAGSDSFRAARRRFARRAVFNLAGSRSWRCGDGRRAFRLT